MEPDQRAAFRSGLRQDAADLLQQPHEPSDACGGLHCHWHGTDEPDEGAYRVCGECCHVYRTAEDLRAAWAGAAKDSYDLPPGTDVTAPPAEQIYACCYCAHDF